MSYTRFHYVLFSSLRGFPFDFYRKSKRFQLKVYNSLRGFFPMKEKSYAARFI